MLHMELYLCGAEIWTLWKVDQRHTETLKCVAGER